MAAVSGTIFEDVNLSGEYEPGVDVPLQFETVFVDLDHNGVQGDTARQVEPDDFVDTAILKDRMPGITLRGADQNNRPTHDITANYLPDFATTGSHVFGRANVPFFNNGARFRVDFHGDARSIEIDFVSAFNGFTETGQLEIYNRDDVLLDTYTTQALATGSSETMSLSRVEGDIAYAVAYIPHNQGSFGRLDNLRYNHLGLTSEVGAITDVNGEYTLSVPDDGEYAIVKTLDDATIQTGPTAHDVTSLFLPIVDRTEHVYDVDRGIMYIGTQSGRIERYHVASDEFLTPLIVGGSIEAMDISPDGDTLYLGEATNSPEAGLIRELNLLDGSVTRRFFPISGAQGGVKDLVATGTGKLLFSIKYNGSNTTPLLRMDLSNGAVDTVNPAVEMNTLLQRSADYRLIFIHGSNSSGNTIMTYDPATDTVVDTAPIANANGAFAAVHPDGSKIAYRSFGNGFTVFNADLTVDETLPHFTGGAVFDARGEFLYVVDDDNDELVALDTVNYNEQFRLYLGEDDFLDHSTFNRTTMTATPDGRQVFVNSPDGVRLFSLAHQASYRVDVQSAGQTFVDLDFGCTQPTFDATQLGTISGQKWHDENNDGRLSGEDGLEDWRIYADLNHNGVWDADGTGAGVGITVEPDDFPDGFVLNRHFPEVTLMVTDDTNDPKFKVAAVTDNQDVSSTGIKVFSHAGVNSFNDDRRLRMDFNVPTRAVAIDFVGSVNNGNVTPDTGRLEVYDAGDNLLDSYDTRSLWYNQVERMHISRPAADIAYAIAYSPQTSKFGRLDNLWFAGTATQSEPHALTDETGAYQLTDLPSGIYDIREEPQQGWRQTYPVQLEQDRLVEIENVSDQIFNPNDDILYITTTDGDIQRYDTATGTLLTPLSNVGTELTSIDITPDGATLYAGDAVVSSGTGFIRKVDVATGNVTSLTFPVTGFQEGVKDIAIGANHRALFSIMFGGSSTVPLFHLDTSTDAITQFQPSVEQSTLISRGADRGKLFIHGSNSHPNTVQIYDSATGAVTDTSTASNVIRARSAVSPASDAVAFRTTNGGLAWLDDALAPTDLLAHLSGPLAFDPVQQRLYVADEMSKQIVAFDTSNQRELYRINIEEFFETDTFVPRVMSLSADGSQLFLSSEDGVHVYAAREASAHRVVLDPGEAVANMDFGNIVVGNVAPLVRNDTYNTNEETDLDLPAPGVLINDIEFNGDDVDALLANEALHGDVTLNEDGSFLYKPDDNFAGTDYFTYEVTDGVFTSKRATVTIHVANINDPPTNISLDNADVEENVAGAVIGAVSVADVDAGESFTYMVSDGRFEVVDGELQLKAGQSLNHESEPTVDVQITATDSGNESFPKTFTITVQDVNEFDPMVTAATLAMDENSAKDTVVGTVVATDNDTSQTLSYAITGGDPGGAFAINGSGVITVANASLLDFEATPQFLLNVTASDNGAPSRSGSATITVNLNDLVGFQVVESDGTTNVAENGTSDTFTVALTDNPAANVVLLVGSADVNEASVSPAELTFTPANWHLPQSVTVTGEDDFLIDGQQTTTITVSVDAGNSDDPFDTLAPQTVSAKTADNDMAGISVVESGDGTAVSESGTTDSFDVTLTAQPDVDVVLMVSSGDPSEATTDVAALTFTADNWNVAQTVTVAGEDDPLLDGTQSTAITLSVDAGASDDHFDSLADVLVSVDVASDDMAGFAVQESDGSTTVAETGTTDTFDVVLDAKPASNVVLTVVSSDTGEATVSTAALTFTPDNWNVAQTVTVSGENDPTVDGEQTSTITIAVDAAASDDDFDAVSPQTLDAATTDDDTAGFAVNESGGDTSVGEPAEEDTFTVVLTRQPLTNVRFSVTSSDATEAALSATALVFTPGNWDAPQTVTVTAVDDLAVDGDVASTVTVAIDATGTDNAFNDLPDATVAVVTEDNDSAGFAVTESDDDTSVSESGATDQLEVALTAQPLSEVVLTVVASNENEATAAPAQLTFTSANWNTPQTVTVTGEDDFFDDGDQASTITISVNAAASHDAFDALPAAMVSVTTTDNDAAGVTIVESDGSTGVAEDGAEDTFTVVLDARPATDVVVHLDSDDLGEATVTPTIMTFTTDNWNAPQTATVAGVDDHLIDGQQLTGVTVSVDPDNSDDTFDGVAPQTINTTTSDDDTAGFTVTADADISVSESGSTSVFSVALTARPMSNVALTVSSSDPDEAAVSLLTVIFAPDQWNTAQAVTISAVNEDLVDGDRTATITIAVDDENSDDDFDPLADQTLSVQTTDNDVAGFTVTESGDSTVVTEGGSQDTLEVVLTAQPLTDVVFNVTTEEDEVLANVASLTFTTQNWDLPQTLTLTGEDDVLDDDDQTTTVTIAVDDLSDSAFADLPAQSVSAMTIDDDELLWHNQGFPEDVNGDTLVTLSDLRGVFVYLLTAGAGPIDPETPPEDGVMVDVSNDLVVNLADLRLVFVYLVDPPAEPEPGEGEAFSAAVPDLDWSRKVWESELEDDWWLGTAGF